MQGRQGCTHDDDDRSTARFLAPLALIACRRGVVADRPRLRRRGDDDGGAATAGTRDLPAATERTSTTPQRAAAHAGHLHGQGGDTLAGIAEKTGVTVERLQELNPDLDPQALVAGQKIKLRE